MSTENPKLGFDLKFDPDRIEIRHWAKWDGIREELRNEYLNLQDKAVRGALISLGWTPPDEKL